MKNFTVALALTGLLMGCQTAQTAAPSATPGARSAAPVSTASPSASSPKLQPKIILGDLKGEGVTLTADHKGRPSSAFSFSGENTGLETTVDLNPEILPQCTLVTWAKFQGDPETQPTFQVVSHDDGEYDRSLGLDVRAGQWGWSCFAGSKEVIGGLPVTPDQWTFLAVVYDQPAKKVTLYAGDQKAEASDAELGKSAAMAHLGRNPGFGEFFQGEVEPVWLFDRALTEEEIRSLKD